MRSAPPQRKASIRLLSVCHAPLCHMEAAPDDGQGAVWQVELAGRASELGGCVKVLPAVKGVAMDSGLPSY